MLQVLLRFLLWDQWKTVLLLCPALDVSRELINLVLLELGLTYLALSDHRGQPPTAVKNTFLHRWVQNYTAQRSSQFKPGGTKRRK